MDRRIHNMRIAVLSGKGGTGKTFVSVNLAAAAKSVTYIDCDVEEPNGHLFFKPQEIEEEDIFVKIPKVDHEKCNGCRKCVDFCKFNALAHIKDRLLIFDELCHSCGGCIMVCPEKALIEGNKVVGKVQKGISGQVNVHTGIVNIGQPTGMAIVKSLLAEENKEGDKQTIIDCLPGSSCLVMESIKASDYCVLVAEPTRFGVHNLNMVYELVKLFNKPHGVVLNKCLEEENPAEIFCLENKIHILGRIPFDHELGSINSNAEIAVNKNEKYREMFSSLLETVTGEVQHETTINP